jgi:outer membrane lipoprotein-sorting protein
VGVKQNLRAKGGRRRRGRGGGGQGWQSRVVKTCTAVVVQLLPEARAGMLLAFRRADRPVFWPPREPRSLASLAPNSRKEASVKNFARLSMAAFVLVMCSTAVRAEDTIESVEKDIIEKWSKMTSLTAKMATDANMGGMAMKMTGTIEFLNKEGKELFRLEAEMEQAMGGQTMKSTILSIVDGEFQWMLMDMGMMKQAMKTKPDDFQGSPGGKKMFEQMKKDNDLKLLPSEKIDDKDCHVIEVKPKKSGEQLALVKMYFAKDTGIMVKMVGYDTGNNAVMTSTYSDIKTNVEIAAERFVFTAPEGVQVMDMTKNEGMPAGHP